MTCASASSAPTVTFCVTELSPCNVAIAGVINAAATTPPMLIATVLAVPTAIATPGETPAPSCFAALNEPAIGAAS